MISSLLFANANNNQTEVIFEFTSARHEMKIKPTFSHTLHVDHALALSGLLLLKSTFFGVTHKLKRKRD